MRLWAIFMLVVAAFAVVGCSSNDEGAVKKEGTVEVIQPKPGDVPPEQRRRPQSEEQ